MRYSSEHKEQSKDRILEAARGRFREHGFDGASIDQVMSAAGLTRGAFYAHFTSKDDLVRQVLDIEAGLVKTLQQAAHSDEPRGAVSAAIADYLDTAQSEDVATGCPLVAHPVDAIRGDFIRKQGYTDQLSSLIASLEVVLDQDDAIAVSVLTVGAGLLSAASADPSLANRIEEVCLAKIEEIVSVPSPS